MTVTCTPIAHSAQHGKNTSQTALQLLMYFLHHLMSVPMFYSSFYLQLQCSDLLVEGAYGIRVRWSPLRMEWHLEPCRQILSLVPLSWKRPEWAPSTSASAVLCFLGCGEYFFKMTLRSSILLLKILILWKTSKCIKRGNSMIILLYFFPLPPAIISSQPVLFYLYSIHPLLLPGLF